VPIATCKKYFRIELQCGNNLTKKCMKMYFILIHFFKISMVSLVLHPILLGSPPANHFFPEIVSLREGRWIRVK